MFSQTRRDESNLPSSADQPCPMHPKQPFERKSSSSLQHCLRLLGRWTLSLGTLLSSPLAVWTCSTQSWDGRSMGEEHLQTRSIWIQLKIVRIQRQKLGFQLHLSSEIKSLRYSTTYQAWHGLTKRLRRFLAQSKTICSSSAAPESNDQKVPRLRTQVITCQSFYKDRYFRRKM